MYLFEIYLYCKSCLCFNRIVANGIVSTTCIFLRKGRMHIIDVGKCSWWQKTNISENRKDEFIANYFVIVNTVNGNNILILKNNLFKWYRLHFKFIQSNSIDIANQSQQISPNIPDCQGYCVRSISTSPMVRYTYNKEIANWNAYTLKLNKGENM